MPADIESVAVVVNSETDSQGRKVRPLPWWGAGQSFAEYVESGVMTDDDALRLGGIDWEVELTPALYTNPVTGLVEEVPGQRVTTRTSDGKPFGVVGSYYKPFQNREMIEFGSVLVDHFGAKWDTVGSLKGGSLVFASIRVRDILDTLDYTPFGLTEEELDLYFLFSNAHDGNRSLLAAITPIRTVCTNTEALALQQAKQKFSIRHTGSLNARVEEARRALDIVPKYLAEYKVTAEQMIESAKSVEEIEKFLAELLPVKDGQRNAKSVEETRGELLDHIRSTPTVPADYRLSSWGVLQGVTEFFEHEKEGRFRKATPEAERRLSSVVFDGAVANVRDRAFDLLRPEAPASKKQLVLVTS